MSGPFNPLAGNFSTTGWVAPTDDYTLKIVKVTYKKLGNDNPKPVLSFSFSIVDGPFANKRPPEYSVWEPESDFSQAGRIIMAAKGFIPGKQDQEFAESNSTADFTLDSSGSDMVMGSDYESLEGSVIRATLGQREKDGKTYQTYKNIRPLNA